MAQESDRTQPVVCRTANAALRQLADDERVERSIGKVKPTHQAKILNGWADYGKSGLVFDRRSKEERQQGPADPIIGPWATADVHTTRIPESAEQKEKGERNPMKIFIQMDEAPYNGEQDRGTKGGIFLVENPDELNGVTCPTEPFAYEYHHFPKPDPNDPNGRDTTEPKKGDVYCIRTRDGERYALMRIDAVCDSGLVFTYKYNGESPEFEAELSPATSDSTIPTGLSR